MTKKAKTKVPPTIQLTEKEFDQYHKLACIVENLKVLATRENVGDGITLYNLSEWLEMTHLLAWDLYWELDEKMDQAKDGGAS